MKLAALSLTEFANTIAGETPTPGGGSVAAYAGALAASLTVMVARLTLGREKYRDAWERMEAVIREAEPLSERLLGLLNEDAEAYNQVIAAFGLPNETETEKTARRAAVQNAFRNATRVPLETLKIVTELAAFTASVVEQGNANCITDAGTAVYLIRTAAHAAADNVRINLGSVSDRAFADRCAGEMASFLDQADAVVRRLEERIVSVLAQ
ncbi:methenyltetrahydrofolate cyclohydrolase [Desulfonema ishimotonii]|uniref:Methenyltetrahydrofolate cyclohydrolase n=1 Tax=Desulfonema ishimotonii TaxID=45657 RepID=A0A401FSB8_9BACT|nr:cyclodeaminase/cyclohydrolase family protein [Desulfonema ishimotonii]GBC59859.1 methenyltetrahydrofolate cyclohydrolase [Desulfonema ishimotonii]